MRGPAQSRTFDLGIYQLLLFTHSNMGNKTEESVKIYKGI